MIKKKVKKIVVNSGLKSDEKDESLQADIKKGLRLITGQKPVPTQARQSISAFDLNQGEIAGYKVTLRGNRKDDFLEKLYKIILQRKKDFSGIPPESFDEQGNLTIGLSEAKVFPELKEKHDLSEFGVEITLVNSPKDPQEAANFLRKKGMPIQKENQEGEN